MKKYFRAEEMHTHGDDIGAWHIIVAETMQGALAILGRGEFTDAVHVDVRELTPTQVAERHFTDDDGKQRPLVEANLGDHFCSEF